MHGPSDRHDASRRKFLLTSAAATTALAATSVAGVVGWKDVTANPKQIQRQSARFVRPNLSAPGFPANGLASYRTAVEAMLRLPPDHPHHWYRLAMTHWIDCRHFSGWFLPWHRGYIGWFERICRKYSNDPNFALPYWDWTAAPSMPPAFFEGVLDVRSSLYYSSTEAFEAAMYQPVMHYWNTLTAAQLKHLASRYIRTASQLWTGIQSEFVPSFYGREPTPEKPDMNEATKKNVAPEVIRASLAPRTFEQFAGSVKEPEGSLLESGPHGAVHSFVGKTMLFNLSPVDPVFYLHHANVDRLWCEWEAMQKHEQLPSLPVGEDYDRWASKTFEFFVDEQAASPADSSVGTYATPEFFGYDYEPASSPILRPPSQPQFRGQEAEGTIQQSMLSFGKDALCTIDMPPVFHQALNAGSHIGLLLTMDLPAQAAAWRFELWLGSGDTQRKDEQLILQFILFGSHGMAHSGALRFGLADALRRLSEAGHLDPNAPLHIRMSASQSGYAEPVLASLEIRAIALELS